MIVPYWKNQPDGQKPQCSFQYKNPRAPPSEADAQEAEEHRKFVIELKRKRKRREMGLRVKLLKKNTKNFIRFLKNYIYYIRE
jgi:hypothetical protein